MKNLMKLKVVILFLIVFNPFITCYAGIFDLINPYLLVLAKQEKK